MNRARTLGVLMILAPMCLADAHAQEKKYDMVPIKYDALKQEVLKHRGKVLIVDFWAGY